MLTWLIDRLIIAWDLCVHAYFIIIEDNKWAAHECILKWLWRWLAGFIAIFLLSMCWMFARVNDWSVTKYIYGSVHIDDNSVIISSNEKTCPYIRFISITKNVGSDFRHVTMAHSHTHTNRMHTLWVPMITKTAITYLYIIIIMMFHQ